MSKRIIASFALVLVLVLLMVACASGVTTTKGTTSAGTSAATTTKGTTSAGTTASTTAKVVKPIVLEFVSNVLSGVQDTWWSKKIQADMKIQLSFMVYSQELMSAYIASADLPDIIYSIRPDLSKLAFDAGLLANYDNYAQIIPNVIKYNPPGSIRYQRERFGDGKGLYALPAGATSASMDYGNLGNCMRIYWPWFMEYVKANGDPVLNDINDFIPIIKWIKEKHPTTADGQKTVGYSGQAQWDSGAKTELHGTITELYGYKVKWPLVFNANTLGYEAGYAVDGIYRRCAKFFFLLNKEGLFDPDAPTMDTTTLSAKVKAGRIIAGHNLGPIDEYKYIPFKNESILRNNGPIPVGLDAGGKHLLVAKNANTERSCELINYLYNPSNLWELTFGPKGEYWDINKEGIPYITKNAVDNKAKMTMSAGGTGNPSNTSIWSCGYWFGDMRNINPVYNISYNTSTWANYEGYEKLDTQKSWEAYMLRLYNIKPKIASRPLSEIEVCEALKHASIGVNSNIPNTTRYTENHTKSTTATMMWKSLFAKDEVEFNKYWDNIKAEAETVWNADESAESIYKRWMTQYNLVNKDYIN